MRRLAFALLLTLFIQTTEAGGDRRRDLAVRAHYIRMHPCPATGQPRGPCPGWQVDHILPLGCGGDDHPANMQWLTIAAHRAKTRFESRHCQRAARALRGFAHP